MYIGKKKFWTNSSRYLFIADDVDENDVTIQKIELKLFEIMEKENLANLTTSTLLEKTRYNYTLGNIAEAKSFLKMTEKYQKQLAYQTAEFYHLIYKILILIAEMAEYQENLFKNLMEKKLPQLKDPNFKILGQVPEEIEHNFSSNWTEIQDTLKDLQKYKNSKKKYLLIDAIIALFKAERARYENLKKATTVIIQANPLTKTGSFIQFFSKLNSKISNKKKRF